MENQLSGYTRGTLGRCLVLEFLLSFILSGHMRDADSGETRESETESYLSLKSRFSNFAAPLHTSTPD